LDNTINDGGRATADFLGFASNPNGALNTDFKVRLLALPNRLSADFLKPDTLGVIVSAFIPPTTRPKWTARKRKFNKESINNLIMKSQDYVFRIDNMKAMKLSRSEIIVKLKEFYKIKDYKSFTRKEWDAWRNKPISSSQIFRLFGSWADALQKAGIKAQRRGRRNLKQMVDLFKGAWKESDGVPTRKGLDNYLIKVSAPYTYLSYKFYWGSIGRLAKRIVEHQEGKITDSELYLPFKSSKKRDKIPQGLRYAVLKRDNEQCVKCGASPKKHGVVLEVDHKIPWSKGGTNELSNLQTLCHRCNRGKKDKEN